MKRQMTFLLLLSILPVGCAQLHTGRTYLSEMEHDDSKFFNPQNDFPIVAGDTGRYWNSQAENKARTPTSADDIARERSQRSLKNELVTLEGSQSERDMDIYEKHKDKLATTSERIYFLKLPSYERMDYLSSRGFTKNREPASVDQMFGLRKKEVSMGMSKNDVMASLGQPSRVEVAGNPSYENERWLYTQNGNSKYIYFESGRVGGWE